MIDVAKITSRMSIPIADIEEIDRKVNAFAELFGEEQFNPGEGGTLLSRSTFYGQKAPSEAVSGSRTDRAPSAHEHIAIRMTCLVAEEYSHVDNSFTIYLWAIS